MWKLTISDAFVSSYKDRMLPGLVQRVKQWGYPFPEIQARLLPDFNSKTPRDTDILIHLLTDRPQDAYDLNNRLMSEFVKDADGNSCYGESTLENHSSPGPYDCLAVIERVFDYHGQLSQSKSKSYWLAEHIGRNTCTYCNRQYTFTVGGSNDEPRKTRPNFDHWFPKSLFPLLSLNVFNLIPSCNICNSGAKGDMIFHLGEFIHPYTQQDDDPMFKFFPAVSDNPADTWHVVLDRDSTSHPEVDNTIKAFGLDEIYDVHGPLEVKELMDFAQAYNGTYLHTIFNMLSRDLGYSGFTQQEVYRILFGTESIPSQYLDRPLSKLKHDILQYLHII